MSYKTMEVESVEDRKETIIETQEVTTYLSLYYQSHLNNHQRSLSNSLWISNQYHKWRIIARSKD
jgi:hypothetical protein